MDVDPESDVTPWLIFCWLMMVVHALKRAHGVLRGFYDLSDMHPPKGSDPWQAVMGYFTAFGWHPDVDRAPPVLTVLHRYAASNLPLFVPICSSFLPFTPPFH